MGSRRFQAFLGTPGALTQRTNENGTRFWVHRYSDAVGRRHEKYPTADRKTYSTLASLHNHGVFRAGAFVIGSHAYGVLLNVLGVKAVPYATEDVDIARREQLALTGIPPFLKMLRETGIKLGHPTSYAEPGGSRLRVDLLVPSPDESYPTIPVPELGAYAQGLPFLRYLLSISQEAPILSPHGVVLVRVPVPERYAIHKLIVSQLRGTVSSKAAKDLRQAATLIEAVIERFPGAIEDALSAVPKSAERYLRRAIPALKRHLPDSAGCAWKVLQSRAW
jgi:hypothetical protein